MLSLGGERLTPPHHPPQKKKFESLPAPRSGYATAIMVVFFAHLLILEYSDEHQNLISSSLYYPGPLHKIWISLKSVHTFLSNGVHRQTNKQTNKQTDRQTNAKKKITSFVQEVIKALWDYCALSCMNLTQHYALTGFQKWGIFVITGFRLQPPAGGAPCRSQQMRFVVPVNNTKIGYEPILI